MCVRVTLVIAIATVGVTACGGSESSASSASAPPVRVTASIVIKNFAFAPEKLQVRTGTAVTWMNADATVHTTTADKVGAVTWDSGSLNPNQSYTVTFTTPGTYSFHCSVHNYMTGIITVTG